MQARVGVDIGGTFTDVALERGGQRYTVKVLTTPHAPEAAVLTGLQRVIEAAGCRPEDVAIVIHGTTLATNALIERKGARTALITTAGFRDVLEMGDESRFEQYDLNIRKPTPLIPRYLRFAVPERMGAQGQVLLALDTDAVAALVPALCEHQIESLAVAFMHSYVNAEHEQQTAAILKQHLPELNISVSSQVSPEIREYERFSTTCANAYVQTDGRRLPRTTGVATTHQRLHLPHVFDAVQRRHHRTGYRQTFSHPPGRVGSCRWRHSRSARRGTKPTR